MADDVKRLCLSLKKGEWLELVFGDVVARVQVNEYDRGYARVFIDAPLTVAIHREKALSREPALSRRPPPKASIGLRSRMGR